MLTSLFLNSILLKKIYQFFKELGYKILTPDYTGKESFDLSKDEKELVEKIYTVCNYERRFVVFLVEIKNLKTPVVRGMLERFSREYSYPFLIFTPDYHNYTFAFVKKEREDVGEFKRTIVKLNLDISNSYYTDKLVLSRIALEEDQPPKAIYEILNDAFSVERVTKDFYNGYLTLFKEVRGHFAKAISDEQSAHDFTQQLLNRIMFIYFISKKRWLGNNTKFLRYFWEEYRKNKGQKTEQNFYEHWLSILFFEAFNNRYFTRSYFSQDLNQSLALSPYLNGGLFRRNKWDDLGFVPPDNLFQGIFDFFDRYNFTIREELPLEVEVAVDPEMIGKVYESLVNLSEKGNERQGAGIFYTPRTEIDFMCRISLIEYFSKHLSQTPKDLIYRLLFDIGENEKEKVDKEISKFSLWDKLENLLDDLSVVDPAVGSGSFLVGMMNILADLHKRVYKYRGYEYSDFDVKKKIIGQSLYGVDVMEWAVHVAELRLWLQLVVETELPLAELKARPLLPNLDFKLRPGDSLVEEIGGENISLLQDRQLPSTIKRKLTNLREEKLRFYKNDEFRKYKDERLLKKEEINVFREVLADRIYRLEQDIFKWRRSLEEPEVIQGELIQVSAKQEEIPLSSKDKIKRKIDELQNEMRKLTEIKENLPEEKNFVIWDIDFVEIFSDEKNGFDIVIGNPPYVRQEKIAPPGKPKEQVTSEDKRLYKEKLLHSVQARYPFITKIDKKADLYVYFYVHGLSLLNPLGTFCFITSNSWLDVGYGKDLQQFLLENTSIKAIFDNQAKRSFERADINTIIVVFNAPDVKNKRRNLENLAKFVMFKKPFEDVIKTENLLAIERADKVISTDDYRVYPVKQETLLEEGWEYPEEATEEEKEKFGRNVKGSRFDGSKWGGKYLRAPDIFFKILEKSHDKLMPLERIVGDLCRGFTTGADPWFYVSDITEVTDVKEIKQMAQNMGHKGDVLNLRVIRSGDETRWLVEKEYIYPVIRNPEDYKRFYIDIDSVKDFVILVKHPRDALKGQLVEKYVLHGEKKPYAMGKGRTCIPAQTKTCASRKQWYRLPDIKPARLLWQKAFDVYHRHYLVSDYVFANQRFYPLYPKNDEDTETIAAFLNSILVPLYLEFQRAIMGLGAIEATVEEVKQILILNPETVRASIKCKLSKAVCELGKREIGSIFHELGVSFQEEVSLEKVKPDRRELDKIIMGDILSLTDDEQLETYRAVTDLAKKRLEKARSV